jgi:transposase InsO family protein
MLRRVFQRWGLPDRLRVDNGHPWGSRNDLPTDLALWLIGLGVNMIWNKPRCPQMNGVVERSQGVTQQWVEPQTLADSTRLQARLDWAVHIQRELYPAVAGRSRLAAFPALATPRRRYQIEIEDALWSLDQVDRFLTQGVWRRRVGRSGQISLYARDYWVGKHQTGQDVSVRFDPTDRHWVVCDHRGQELRRHRAEQLTRERIVGLKVAHRPAQ